MISQASKFMAGILILMMTMQSYAAPFFKAGFTGKEGEAPNGWKWYGSPPDAGSGLTGKFKSQDNQQVVRIVSSAKKIAALQTLPMPFPARSGVICFKIKARSVHKNGKIRLFLLGDSYKWKGELNATVTTAWKEYAVMAKIPQKIVVKPEFWARIDVMEGSDILVDAPNIQLLPLGAIKPVKPEPASKKTAFKDGLFRDSLNNVPEGWRFNYAKPGEESGLTGKFNFKDYPLVMRIVGPKKAKAVALQSVEIPFPGKKAVIRYSVWARSAGNNGKMRLFLLGDSYKWNTGKEFMVTSAWKKYSIQAPTPEKIVSSPKFWLRIDVPSGSDLLIGKTKLDILKPEKHKSGSEKNLVENGDFSFKGWGWNRYYGAKYKASLMPKALQQPEFKNDRLFINSFGIHSWLFNYRPNHEYTIRIRMKNAEAGKQTIITVFFINSDWKLFKKDFKLTDKFKDYTLTGRLPVSKYNRAYVRMDVQKGKAEVDRVEVREGRHSSFAPLPSLQLGVTGRTLFDLGEKNPKLKIRLKQNGKPKQQTIKMTVTDYTGRVIDNTELKFPSSPDSTLDVPIPCPEQRGIFKVVLKASDGSTTKLRYAILKNLGHAKLPSNPFGGHYEPYTEQNLQKYDRYFPVYNTINRFMSPRDMKAVRSPVFQKELAESPYKNVMRMPYIDEIHPHKPCTLTPEVEAKLLKQVAECVTACKGKLYGVELINEPHLWRIRSGPDAGKQSMPPKKMAYLLKKIYPVVKKIDPNMKVFGPVSSVFETKWAKEFVEAGGAKYIDAIDFHGYNNDPDYENAAAKIKAFGEIFNVNGRQLPLYNSEAYYGVRETKILSADAEYKRVYYRDTELDHASVISSFLIHHAVNGAVFCNFMPRWLLYGVMASDEIYPLLAAGAINAGIEFLGTAGKGQEIKLDQTLRCFIFPDAADGPLGTIKTIGEVSGTMVIPPEAKAFDILGNLIDGPKIKLGVPVVYLRFPKGSDGEKEMKKLKFTGLGSPFKIKITLLDAKTLCANVRNQRFQSQDLTLKITRLPSSWVPAVKEIKAHFGPNEEKRLLFPMKSAKIDYTAPLKLEFIAKSQDKTIVINEKISLLTAEYSANLSFDGVKYLNMDKRFESCPFAPGLKHNGNEDLSARFAAVWNKTGLKLRFLITDNKHVAPKDFLNAWKFDSIQLYFDMSGNATRESEIAKRLRADDVYYNIAAINGKPGAYLSFANGTRYIGAANATTGFDDAVKVSCERKKPNIIEYTIFLPHEALYMVKFEPGSSFGFSALINDNDGKGRKPGLTLCPKGTEPFLHAHLFRRMILIKKSGTEKHD